SFIADEVQRSIFIERQPDALFVLNSAESHIDEDAVLFRKKFWCDTRRRNTPGVEGTHRELRSRFADRLGGDGSDSFALADDNAVGEVDAVAFCADAAFRFASQCGTDADAVDAGVVDRFSLSDGENISGAGEDLCAIPGLVDVIANGTAVDTVFNGKEFFLSL